MTENADQYEARVKSQIQYYACVIPLGRGQRETTRWDNLDAAREHAKERLPAIAPMKGALIYGVADQEGVLVEKVNAT